MNEELPNLSPSDLLVLDLHIALKATSMESEGISLEELAYVIVDEIGSDSEHLSRLIMEIYKNKYGE